MSATALAAPWAVATANDPIPPPTSWTASTVAIRVLRARLMVPRVSTSAAPARSWAARVTGPPLPDPLPPAAPATPAFPSALPSLLPALRDWSRNIIVSFTQPFCNVCRAPAGVKLRLCRGRQIHRLLRELRLGRVERVLEVLARHEPRISSPC